MSVEAISSALFGQRLLEGCRGERIPLSGTIELTRRCPLQCVHCYNRLPLADSAAAARELSCDQHRRILDEITRAGGLWITLTGGEPMARPDFLEIYRHARSNGLLVSIFTNATLVTERIADELAQWRPVGIEVTLYGATQTTFEAMTRSPGSFERCLAGVRMLLARELPLRLKAVATRLTRDEIPAMRRMADELGLSFKFDGLINPGLDGSLAPLEVRLRPEELVALDLGFEDRVRAFRELLADSRRQVLAEGDARRELLYQCGAGLYSFAIDPYGGLSLCLLSEQEKYDLVAGSFAEGWEHFLGPIRARRLTRPSHCNNCSLRLLCGQCPATALLETNDAEAPVEFYCQVSQLHAASIEGSSSPGLVGAGTIQKGCTDDARSDRL